MPLNMLQRTRQHTAKNYLVGNVSGAEVEEPWTRLPPQPTRSLGSGTWEAISTCRRNEQQCWAGALLARCPLFLPRALRGVLPSVA